MPFHIPKPSELYRTHSNHGFPLHALGPECQLPVGVHHQATGISEEMIATCALSSIVAAAQDLADVQRPNMRPTPCSNFFLIITDPVEGKDTASAPFLRGFRLFEEKLVVESECARHRYRAALAAWAAEERAIKRQMQDAVARGSSMAQLQHQYSILSVGRPKPPKVERIIHDNATGPGLEKSIAAGSDSVYLHDPDGGTVVNRLLGQAATFMNKAWDATPSIRHRASDEPRSLADCRMSALILLQPYMFKRFLDRHGEQVSGSGLTSRTLMIAPQSTLGSRILDADSPPVLDSLSQFSQRVVDLLEEARERRQQGKTRVAHSFTPEAARFFVSIFNEIQLMLGPGQPLNVIKAHAGRAPEHVARIACAMHTFEGLQGPIQVHMVERAAAIVRYFLNSFYQMSTVGQATSRLEADIRTVVEAVRRAAHHHFEAFTRNELANWTLGLSQRRVKDAVAAMLDRRWLATAVPGSDRFLKATPLLPFIWPAHAPAVPFSASGSI